MLAILKNKLLFHLNKSKMLATPEMISERRYSSIDHSRYWLLVTLAISLNSSRSTLTWSWKKGVIIRSKEEGNFKMTIRQQAVRKVWSKPPFERRMIQLLTAILTGHNIGLIIGPDGLQVVSSFHFVIIFDIFTMGVTYCNYKNHLFFRNWIRNHHISNQLNSIDKTINTFEWSLVKCICWAFVETIPN